MTPNRIDSESFSSVDAAWLHMDRPTNLAVITGVITFSGQMDVQRLKDTLATRMLVHKRFLQRVRASDHRLSLPRWERDPDFDIDRHIQTISLPEPADQEALQQMVGEMISQPLDPDRPLWVFYVVDNYVDGSALICRLHHCIADGLALVQVLLAMTDLDPDAPWAEPTAELEELEEESLMEQLFGPAYRVARTIGHTWRTAESLVHGGFETLVHPRRLRSAAHFSKEATRALAKLLLIGPDRSTGLRGKCGISKRAVWSSDISLEEVKRIGHLMGGTVNDILLSALTGAFRRYLEESGETIDGLNIRGILPVNLRPPEELDQMGNRFGLVFLSLPVGTHDPLKRLVTLKRRMNAIKDTPEAVVAFGILGAIGLSPTQVEDIIISIFGMKGTAVITNVPGPRQPLYFAGQKIETLMFWVPTPANLAVGVSIISYAGQVILGITTDEGLIPDPENILRSFYDELEFLKHWGRPASSYADRRRPETTAPASQPVDQPPVVSPFRLRPTSWLRGPCARRSPAPASRVKIAPCRDKPPAMCIKN